MSRNKDIIYKRELVWVQHYPLTVRVDKVGSGQERSWISSSILAAIIQTGPDGEAYVAVREDGPFFDFRPGEMALKHIGADDPERVTRLSPAAFDEFASIYMGGANDLALGRIVRAIEKHVPAFRFMPRHLHDLAAETPYLQLPRYFMRHDLREFECLAWIGRSPNQISPRGFEEWQIDADRMRHMGSGWYAFVALDDAVRLKFLVPNTEVHSLRGGRDD
jgi:hypothetical protein